MPKPSHHQSALPSHYNLEAKHYDAFNEKASELINQTIENILNEHSARTILDLTCGTGSQVFWLAQKGFEVMGIDINEKMLEIAQQKAKQKNLSLHFELGDIRTSKIGQFDAVLTIFNAIGHLTKTDFELAIQNIHANLKPGGLYILDIFNLDYLLHEDNITQLTIDWQKKSGDFTAREIQYSTISANGILASYDICHEQKNNDEPTINTAFQTLQVYSAAQLRNLLERNNFEVIQQTAIDGSELKIPETDRILTVAKKQ
jgi:2-polyprenyl-3-methyl-5-hydroxy-6-metoxy-1,4-benzoquinol methylase